MMSVTRPVAGVNQLIVPDGKFLSASGGIGAAVSVGGDDLLPLAEGGGAANDDAAGALEKSEAALEPGVRAGFPQAARHAASGDASPASPGGRANCGVRQEDPGERPSGHGFRRRPPGRQEPAEMALIQGGIEGKLNRSTGSGREPS